jgi:cytochrome P450
MPFLTKYMLSGTGILFSHKPDKTWKSLRMASHKHLKQFGDGLSKLEDVITDVAEEMFSTFKHVAEAGTDLDPKSTIFDTALITIAFLITGVRSKPGDEIVEKMREYENTVLMFIGGTKDLRYTEYDRRPWLRHIRAATWRTIENVRNLQGSIWNDVQSLNKQFPESKSLFNVLMAYVPDHNKDNENRFEMVKNSPIEFSDEDVKMTILSLLLAGVTTTSTSFYSLINILAHRPHIQDKLFEEVKKVGKTSIAISLIDRQDMPYTRAVIFELLRYVSVVPVGVPHRTVSDVDICGIMIPNDTVIATNLWALHHDPNFWTDPYNFLPERFLDATGNMVPADHPNRKHLMPFGAGPRVCLGEAMALARIFLWIASFSQRFQVFPADGNAKELTDPRKYEFDGVVRICPYKVKFIQRESFKSDHK